MPPPFIRLGTSQSGQYDVPVGTAGQVLTSNGATAAPTFQAGGAGGGNPFDQDLNTDDPVQFAGVTFASGAGLSFGGSGTAITAVGGDHDGSSTVIFDNASNFIQFDFLHDWQVNAVDTVAIYSQSGAGGQIVLDTSAVALTASGGGGTISLTAETLALGSLTVTASGIAAIVPLNLSAVPSSDAGLVAGDVYHTAGALMLTGAGGVPNPFDQDLNTTDAPEFAGLTLPGLAYNAVNGAVSLGVNYTALAGNDNPGVQIGSNADGWGAQLILGSDDANTGAPELGLWSSNGTTTTPEPTTTGNQLGVINWRGYATETGFPATVELRATSTGTVAGGAIPGKLTCSVYDETAEALQPYLTLDGGLSQIVLAKALHLSSVPSSDAGLSAGDLYHTAGALMIKL